MATPRDFRTYAFDVARIEAAGRHIGRQTYWRLYSIENLVRVLVHSVLTAQVGPNWWALTADPGMQGRVARFQADYAGRPWHSSPGRHEIYYLFLSDLTELIRVSRHLFAPLVADIDAWIARLEQARLPRNIVGHMNWLTTVDRHRVEVIESDLRTLLNHLGQGALTLLVP